MFAIRHKGMHFSIPMDPTEASKPVKEFLGSNYCKELVAGRMVKMTPGNAYAEPFGETVTAADHSECLGVLAQDAAGLFYGANMPVAGKNLSIATGDMIFATDQFVEASIPAGTLLYIGAKGQFTSTAVADATPVGRALEARSTNKLEISVQWL